MSVKTFVRKAAFKAMGCVEIPYGGKVGLTPEQERAAAVRAGRRPVWFPRHDPRHSHLCVMMLGGDREATAEEADFYLILDREHLERHGLTFAEPGDPDAFMVKWQGRARDRERIEAERGALEVCHE